MSREMETGARWQEITHLVNSWVHGQRKQEPPDGQETTLWVISVLEAHKERWGKVGISWVLMQPIAHYGLITIQLALQIRSTQHAPMPWHFWSKLNKDKNPSSPQEDGAGMKIKIKPQTPPSSMNIPPLRLYAPHNRLAKENQGSGP